MSSSVLGAVQALLHGSGEQGDTHSLAKQVSISSTLLRDCPALYGAALSVLSSAYQHYIIKPDQVIDRGLGSALQEAETVISSLLDHAPQTWSRRVLQWCVEVASDVSRCSQYVEDLPRLLLQQPKLRAVVKFLETCTSHLVASGRCKECVEVVARECLKQAPRLDWLLNHVLSLQPDSLIPPFLEQVLCLPLSHQSPAFTTVGQTLEFLGHNSRAVVGASVLSVVEKVVRGELRGEEGWGKQVETLLRLAPLCEGLLSFIIPDCLQMVTAEKMRAIVIASSSSGDGTHDSHMTSDEDEGEVRSDDDSGVLASGGGTTSDRERVQRAVVDMIRVLRKDSAAQAVSQVVQTYSCLLDLAQSQEEAMEEGEIVRVSVMNVVQEACQAILSQLLQQLHTAALAHLTMGPHTAKGTGSEAELAVSLQSGLSDWCLLLVQTDLDNRCCEWMCSALAYVCVCAAELQAAQALASMILHCHNPQHLVYVLRVYGEVSVRYSQLTKSIIQSALASCGEGAESRVLPYWFCMNLWRLTVCREGGVAQQTRSNFTAAVRACLLPLSVLLCELSQAARVEEMWRVLEVVGEVEGLESSEGDYSAHCQVISNLLSFFFNCIILQCGKEVDVRVDLCIARCSMLLAKWVGPGCRESLRVFLLTSLIKRAMSQDVAQYLGGEVKGRRRPYQCKDLLSSSHKPPRTQVHSRDTAQQLRSQSGDLPVANGTNHILSLLEGVARGNGELVVSVLLDRVAPHLPSDAAPWLPGEGPRSTSLEWSLLVKQQFDKHPILWHWLLFSSHCGCGFAQCEPVMCSLLLVLTQHWFSVRYSGAGVVGGRELLASQLLVETLSAAGWLPTPLNYCAELFQSVSSHDLYLLFNSISEFMKVNLQQLRRGELGHLKGTAHKEVLKGVLVRNIHKLGHVYAHYMMS